MMLWLICKQKKENQFHEIFNKTVQSVEVTKFFYPSDFTWNQFQGFLMVKNAIFAVSEAHNFIYLVDFCPQKLQKIIKI